MKMLRLTVVAPVFNEQEVIRRFYERTRNVLAAINGVEATILFVVDRSTDSTLDILRDISKNDSSARILALSSRFGHQMSLLAGIEHSLEADAIVMMDSDLQHPPELIPELLENFKRGFEIVFTVRRDTDNIGEFRKLIGDLFYRALGKISQVQINANSADFRLISRRVATTLVTEFKERNMFLRGLFSWIGFRQTGIEFVAQSRAAGTSKYSFSRMLQLAMAGILSFSTKPLHIGIFVGVGFAALAFVYMAVVVVNFFVDRSIPSGWTTLAALFLLFNGVQLIVLGIMGAYIGGIYEEVKGRPHYIVEEKINFQ
jgi:glycosyltransferase involved in cell wall biosynthesis